MKNEYGRTMIEMLGVLSIIGILTIGGIMAFQNGQTQNEANKINELVSIASLNGLTKMKDYDNTKIWKVIGKKKADYKCVDSLVVEANGQVKIIFSSDCDKVKKILTSQWGNRWNKSTHTYTPPEDDDDV